MTELIKNDEQFKKIFLLSMTCVFIDSGREPTPLVRLAFDDIEIGTPAFASLVQNLLQLSGDDKCHYIVLRPDPVLHFHRLYGEYPAVEITKGMTQKDYIVALNTGPTNAPYETVGSAYRERVIVSPSLSWFVHSFVSSEDTDGHLWVPKEWVKRIREIYEYDLTA